MSENIIIAILKCLWLQYMWQDIHRERYGLLGIKEKMKIKFFYRDLKIE